jgi:hypothetical protein
LSLSSKSVFTAPARAAAMARDLRTLVRKCSATCGVDKAPGQAFARHPDLFSGFLDGLDVAGHQMVDRGVDPLRHRPLADAGIHGGFALFESGEGPLGRLLRRDVFHGRHHRRA